MAVCSKLRKVNMHVYTPMISGFKRISCFDHPEAERTVHVLYQGGVHYDELVTNTDSPLWVWPPAKPIKKLTAETNPPHPDHTVLVLPSEVWLSDGSLYMVYERTELAGRWWVGLTYKKCMRVSKNAPARHCVAKGYMYRVDNGDGVDLWIYNELWTSPRSADTCLSFPHEWQCIGGYEYTPRQYQRYKTKPSGTACMRGFRREFAIQLQ